SVAMRALVPLALFPGCSTGERFSIRSPAQRHRLELDLRAVQALEVLYIWDCYRETRKGVFEARGTKTRGKAAPFHIFPSAPFEIKTVGRPRKVRGEEYVLRALLDAFWMTHLAGKERQHGKQNQGRLAPQFRDGIRQACHHYGWAGSPVGLRGAARPDHHRDALRNRAGPIRRRYPGGKDQPKEHGHGGYANDHNGHP